MKILNNIICPSLMTAVKQLSHDAENFLLIYKVKGLFCSLYFHFKCTKFSKEETWWMLQVHTASTLLISKACTQLFHGWWLALSPLFFSCFATLSFILFRHNGIVHKIKFFCSASAEDILQGVGTLKNFILSI